MNSLPDDVVEKDYIKSFCLKEIVHSIIIMQPNKQRGSPCDRVVNMLNCGIVVSEFRLCLCNYFNFQT